MKFTTKLLRKVLNISKWTTIFSLCIISVFVIQGAWQKYYSGATSLSRFEKDLTIRESPTMILSFWPLKFTNYSNDIPYQTHVQFEINKDFNGMYYVPLLKIHEF